MNRLYLARTFEREGEVTSSNMSYKRYLDFTRDTKTLDLVARSVVDGDLL